MVQWLAPLDLLFNLFLITALYLTVVRGINVARAEPWIVFLIWVLPAIASAILLSIGGIFGPAGAWCWVTLEHFNLRISVLYAWVWTGFVLMLTMEALVIRRLRVLAQVAARVPGTPVQARLQQHRFTSGMYLKLSYCTSFWFCGWRTWACWEGQEGLHTPHMGVRCWWLTDPLIYIVTWTPSTVNRILERFNMALVDNSTAFAAQLFSIQTGGFLFFMLFLRNNWGTLRRVPAPPTPTVTTALLSSQCDAHSAGDPRPALPLHHSGGHSRMTDP